jgi:microcystin-dependent protein
MSDQYLGEIRMLAGSFAPVDWALCDGRELSTVQYDSLFALIGTTFGGDGVNTFALPDLRGRAPMHFSERHVLGEMAGQESMTLTIAQLPVHTHALEADADNGNTSDPAGAIWARSDASKQYAPVDAAAPAPMNSGALTYSGDGRPHENMPPFLAINFIIALAGVVPARI